MKIDTARDDLETRLMQHYRPKERPDMERKERIAIRNVIIVIKKDIYQRIAGLKEVEWRGKDPKGGRDQTGRRQIRPKKSIPI
jgi:hypothetical protein